MVTISFTKLLTVLSIRDNRRGSIKWVDSLWWTTKFGSIKEWEEPELTRAFVTPGNIVEDNSTKRALKLVSAAALSLKLGSLCNSRQIISWEAKILLILFLRVWVVMGQSLLI